MDSAPSVDGFKTEPDPVLPYDWTWGVVLLLVAFVFGVWSLGIRAPAVGGQHDLGPRAFPWIICAFLVACAVQDFTRIYRHGTKDTTKDTATDREPVRWRELIQTCAALTVCLLAIGWLSAPYTLATAVLGVVLLRQFGTGWVASILYSLALAAWIKLMFGWGFEVQLNDGWLDRILESWQ